MSAVYEMPSYNNKLMKSYNTNTEVELLTRSIQSNVILYAILPMIIILVFQYLRTGEQKLE